MKGKWGSMRERKISRWAAANDVEGSNVVLMMVLMVSVGRAGGAGRSAEVTSGGDAVESPFKLASTTVLPDCNCETRPSSLAIRPSESCFLSTARRRMVLDGIHCFLRR